MAVKDPAPPASKGGAGVPDAVVNLRELQQRLGYQFVDHDCLELALTHRSRSGSRNNERLEFLGDAYLGYVVAAELYRRHHEVKENELTLLRASLVRGKTLADVARSIGLGQFLLLGSGERKSGGFRRDSILADTVEALIGAVLLDGGPAPAEALILRLLGDRFDLAQPGAVSKDPKTRLQELLQGRGEALPDYEVTDVQGSDHEQVFSVTCRISSLGEEWVGCGRSRRAAEQEAATQVLAALGAQDS